MHNHAQTSNLQHLQQGAVLERAGPRRIAGATLDIRERVVASSLAGAVNCTLPHPPADPSKANREAKPPYATRQLLQRAERAIVEGRPASSTLASRPLVPPRLAHPSTASLTPPPPSPRSAALHSLVGLQQIAIAEGDRPCRRARLLLSLVHVPRIPTLRRPHRNRHRRHRHAASRRTRLKRT